MGEPETERELIARARALAGMTLSEVASREGRELPADLRRKKGAVGELLEAALGAPGTSSREPDFARLGVELKTLPVRADGAPVESTFVCTIPLAELPSTDFEASVLWGRLRRVLFVPVEAARDVPLAQRRVGTAFLWSPNDAERETLRADWERVAAAVARGEIEAFRAHEGVALQVRPKARDASVRRLVETADGDVRWVRPRGFYLRASFTRGLVARAMGAA